MFHRAAALWTSRTRHRSDAGYSAETVVVIALLAILAVGAVTVISETVLDRAESITLE